MAKRRRKHVPNDGAAPAAPPAPAPTIATTEEPDESGANAAEPMAVTGCSDAPAAELAPPPVDAWIGRVLDGRYRIDARLGAGGVGAVYRATQLNLQRVVAVKVLLEGLHPSFRARFEREAKALAAMRHPNIVAVTDFGMDHSPGVDGEEHDTPFIVMELIEGVTLHHRLQQGPLPPVHAQTIARELLRALSFVHAQGLVHRDLKPGNVLLERLPHDEERVRLLDFGLAKALAGTGPEGETVTRAGDVLGTPAYMAPEQIGGDAVDVRTDTYACGVLLFQMITGRPPFEGEPVEMLRSHLITPAPSLSARRPDLGVRPELEALLARALAKKRDERFQTCDELLAALEGIPQPWWSSDSTLSGEFAHAATVQAAAQQDADSVDAPTRLHVPSAQAKAQARAGAAPPARWQVTTRSRKRMLGWTLLALLGVAWLALRDSEPQLSTAAGTSQVDDEMQPAAVTEGSDTDTTAPDDTASEDLEADAPTMVLTTAEIEALQREPARNPWAGPVPRALLGIRKAVVQGDRGNDKMIASLRRYNREHPRDARGHLLLAQLYRNRSWRDDALNQYTIAYQRDPRVRGAPEMLRDLIQLVAHGDSAGRRAADFIASAYGKQALPALERALAGAPAGNESSARWLALKQTLER